MTPTDVASVAAMRRPRRRSRPILALAPVLAVALIGAACSSGDGDDEVTAEGDESSTSVTEGSSTTESSLADTSAVGSSTTETLAASTSTSGSTTSESTTTIEPSTTTTTEPSTTAEPSTTTTTTPGPTLIDGGSDFAFTSPSGNITCLVTDAFIERATCWIGEKDWTIDQPDDPDCADADWGNAVEVGTGGPSFPCYTDFIWVPDADPLDYGLTVVVGEFRCESARTGVTCTNGDGRGFTLARTALDLF